MIWAFPTSIKDEDEATKQKAHIVRVLGAALSTENDTATGRSWPRANRYTSTKYLLQASHFSDDFPLVFPVGSIDTT